jgi:predicted nucleotidyltransferase
MVGLGRYRDCKKKAEQLVIDDVIVTVISLEDLIMNKRAVNRATDQSDIQELNRLNKKKGKSI